MSNVFFNMYTGTLLRPQRTFNAITGSQSHLSKGFFAVLIMATVYTCVYIFLIFGGGQPFKPWLDIPLDKYYRYNVFFCGPSMFLGWILASGVVHSLSRLITVTGTFEQIMTLFGFGIGIASWSTGIHDWITSFLGAVHIIDQRQYELMLNSPTIWRVLLWIQMAAYVIWVVLLFSKAVRSVYKVSIIHAFFLGTLGFFVYQLFFLIFNR